MSTCVFVCDTMMRDGQDHWFLGGAKFLGRGRLDGYSIFTFHGAPIVMASEDHCWGEAFALPRDTEDEMLEQLQHLLQEFKQIEVTIEVDTFPLRVITWIVENETVDGEGRINHINRRTTPSHERRRLQRESVEAART